MSFQAPGSRAMRSSTSARSRGASSSYAGRYDLTAAARPRGMLRPQTRKSSCSRCSGRDFRRGLREFRRRSARDGAPADLRLRESFPACRCRIARRRARETPAARRRDARRARRLRSCESSRPPRATAGTRQLFTSAPSISTAHAPHSPSPQPSFVPVRPSSSRSTSSRRAIGYASSAAGFAVHLALHADFARARQACTVSSISASTSGVTGTRRMSTPVACAIAFAIAGAVPSSGKLADAFRAGRPARVGNFLEVDANRRHVHRGGHDVVRHLAVDHAAFLPHDIFVKREADALRHAALDLSGCEDGIDDLADFLHGDEIFDAHFGGAHVDGNFRDVDGPAVGAVGVALICSRRPNADRSAADISRTISAGRTSRCIARRRARILRLRILASASALSISDCWIALRGGFHELADDHRGARRDRGAAIGHVRGIGLDDFDLLGSRCRALRRRSA